MTQKSKRELERELEKLEECSKGSGAADGGNLTVRIRHHRVNENGEYVGLESEKEFEF